MLTIIRLIIISEMEADMLTKEKIKDRKLSVAKVMVKGLRIHAEQRRFIWLS